MREFPDQKVGSSRRANSDSPVLDATEGLLTQTTEDMALLHDADFDGLSLYEKKSLVVNRELDAMGMGRYQWYIWTLCGLGYFLDLLWSQAFGLIAAPLQQELGFSDTQLANIFTAFNSGLTAGAFVWGVLVDVIGRRWAFNGTVFISSLFGICLGAPDSYNAILVIAAFTGFGIGGNIPIDTTIALEFLPQNRRFLLALLSIFQPLGVLVCSGIAYALIPSNSCDPDIPSCKNLAQGAVCCTKAANYGWRYLVFTLGGISFFVFFLRFLVFTFQESPKYLLGKGKDEEALKVLHAVARTNKRQCSISMETFEALAQEDDTSTSSDPVDFEIPEGFPTKKKTISKKIRAEVKRTSILFSTPILTRVTILVWIIYAFDYWGFSIAGSFLPTILRRKNSSINVSISDTYRDYIIIYSPGIIGVGLGSFMETVPSIGRKWAMVLSSLLMGVSLFLFAAVNTHASNVGLNAMEYFFQSMFNAVLYGWTPEAFPAPVRGTASGLASFWGRLFSIFSPLIAGRLLESSLNGPLYLAGSGVFVCTLAILGLPKKSLLNQESM